MIKLKETIDTIQRHDIKILDMQRRGVDGATAAKLKVLGWMSRSPKGTESRAYYIHSLVEVGEVKAPSHSGWSKLLGHKPRCPKCKAFLLPEAYRSWAAYPSPDMGYCSCLSCDYEYANFGL